MDACKTKKACEIDKTTNLGCGRHQPHYSKQGLGIIQTDQGGVGVDSKSVFRAEDARRLLSKIPEKDIILMGMNPKESRPEWMIIKVLPVGPPPIRPSV